MKLTTTFKKLHEANACTYRYKFLRKALSNITDDEPINLLTILETNGLDDALWALRATEQNCDRIARLMAADFVEEVIPIWIAYSATDNSPQLAIKAARDFANGLITDVEMAPARDAARDAGNAAWAAVKTVGVAIETASYAAWAAWAAWAAVEIDRVAARDVAKAARTTAGAAGDAARAKQCEILIRYLQEDN
jgi:hypothetical protein